MKDNICTIPINDAFLPRKGCPLCRMVSMLEERSVDFILGGAMMQPDIRIQTNKLGFCREHFTKMLKTGKRLQNALILESHLKHISSELLPDKVKGKPDKKLIEKINSATKSCYICGKIEWGIEHLCATVISSWENDGEFRALFEQQEYICMEHYYLLLKKASEKGISSKKLPEFYSELNRLSSSYLRNLQGEIRQFCDMFDYRNKDKDVNVSKDCIERAINFLCGDSKTEV